VFGVGVVGMGCVMRGCVGRGFRWVEQVGSAERGSAASVSAVMGDGGRGCG
jgi:hypothetical protein